MASFYGLGSIASRLQPLRRGYLVFTKLPRNCAGTHFINLGRMKGSVNFGAIQRFLTRTPGLGTQHLNQNHSRNLELLSNKLSNLVQFLRRTNFSRETRNRIYIYLIYGKLVIFNVDF